MISRLIESLIFKSPKSVLLLGPRQVGKSTLIRRLKPDIEINLNDDKTFLDFRSNPNELKDRLAANKYRTVFIDEIQRHPSLLNTIQTIVDSEPKSQNPKFYLTGSSARKLKRGQANLLPGRIFAYELGPLCAAELDYKLDINRSLKYGCLPEAYLEKNSAIVEKMLTTYSGVYLKEEIQAEALTRNLDGFSRFVIAAAECSGQILDFSKLAKQAKIERKNCSRFFEILEDTLIAFRLEVYSRTGADIKKRPKFYFFDPGVLNGLLGNFNVSGDRKGLLFENLVVSQIMSSAKAHDKQVHLSYFRTRSGYEIDLILELNQKTYAIEVKSGKVDSGDASKIEKFYQYQPKLTRAFIVCADTANRKIGKVFITDLPGLLKEIGL